MYDQDAVIHPMGYPDMGSGFYSKKLAYRDWYRFNCAQRVHGNSVEHLTWLVPLLLVSAVFQPRFTACLTLPVLFGRELYKTGYMSPDGPNSKVRECGAIPLNIAEIFLILGVGSIWFRKRYEGLLRNRRIYKRMFVS